MMRVAVIDNSPDFVDLIAQILAERGGDTSPFTSMEGLLPRLRHDPPDMILLDLRLDRQICGWDVASQLELDPILHATPLIICSAAIDMLRQRAAWLTERGLPARLVARDGSVTVVGGWPEGEDA